MNKWEKEVMQHQLTAEQAVIKELEAQYKRALHEINLKIRILKGDDLTQSKIYQINYQEALKGQIEGILEKLHGDEFTSIQEYLKECYTDGFIGTMYDIAGQGIPLMIPIDQNAAVKAIMTDSKINEGLYKAIGVDTAELKKRIRSEITRGLAANDTYESIAQSISLFTNAPLKRARTIVRTEGHRIQQASTEDARQAAKKRGCDILKVWDSTLDGKTRPTHRKLDGQIRETDELFEMDGKKAKHPGDFGRPEEDCNCRCTANSIPRWALDEAELEEQKERAKFFGIDKTKDFEEYKEKYLKAAAREEELEKEFKIAKTKDFEGGKAKSLQATESADENPPIMIAGLDCKVSKREFGFNDGRGGAKKIANAVVYETPDGTQFIFPEKYNKKQQTMTPEQAISLWAKVPENIRKKAQKTVQFVDYYNPRDAEWRKKYKNFSHSYATGGQTITFWRYEYPHDEAYVVHSYCHEIGHFIDKNLAKTADRFSSETRWINAMVDDMIISQKTFVTSYAQNGKIEDFAESVAEYVKDKAKFEKNFPNRAAILAEILK